MKFNLYDFLFQALNFILGGLLSLSFLLSALSFD